MNILITGIAGFIGFNFCKKLSTTTKKIRIIGIDNINNYYSQKVKIARLQNLKKSNNIEFKKIDIKNKSQLTKLFKKYKFTEVYNFAAQAGVRYSIINPQAYIDTNVVGFSNLMFLSKEYNVKKFFFASSSSVYGENSKYPIPENVDLDPQNLYGLTKKYNEELAALYFKNFKFKSIGLRFFTVFGEWGRPDMFIYKYLAAAYNKKKFFLNNYGNHFRDFTYIEDAINILIKLRNKKINKYEVYNVCSNNPYGLLKIIDFFKKKIPKVKIIKRKKDIADIYKTHGDNKKIIKKTGFKKFTETKNALNKTFLWFSKNKSLFK